MVASSSVLLQHIINRLNPYSNGMNGGRLIVNMLDFESFLWSLIKLNWVNELPMLPKIFANVRQFFFQTKDFCMFF